MDNLPPEGVAETLEEPDTGLRWRSIYLYGGPLDGTAAIGEWADTADGYPTAMPVIVDGATIGRYEPTGAWADCEGEPGPMPEYAWVQG